MTQTQADFYSAMARRYAALSGFVPDEASDTAIRLRTLAAELEALSARITHVQKQLSPQTAEGKALDEHAAARGIARRAAQYARGELLFSRAQQQGQAVIERGTRCTADDGTEYETVQERHISEGELEVLVPARACIAGKVGNALAGTIARIGQLIPGGVSRVSNPNPFTGGTDSESDDALRQRVLAAYRTASNGANAAYYRQVAEAFDGISCALVTAGEKCGSVIVTVAADGRMAVPDEVLDALSQEFATRREPCTQVTVQNAQAVTLDITAAVETQGAFAQTQERLTEYLRAFLDSRAIGQRVTCAQIGQLLMESGLVSNYRLQLPAQDIYPAAGQVIRAGEILLKQMSGVGA